MSHSVTEDAIVNNVTNNDQLSHACTCLKPCSHCCLFVYQLESLCVFGYNSRLLGATALKLSFSKSA